MIKAEIYAGDVRFLNHSLNKKRFNKRYVVYGAGTYGKRLHNVLVRNNYYVVGWVDSNYASYASNENEIVQPNMIPEWDFDYCIVAMKSEKNFNEVYQILQEMGIGKDKIIWLNLIEEGVVEKKGLQKKRIKLLEKYRFLLWLEGFMRDSFAREVMIDCIIKKRWNYGKQNFYGGLRRIVLRGGSYDIPSWHINEYKRLAYMRNAKVACSSFIAIMKEYDASSGINVHDFARQEEIRGKLDDPSSYFKFTYVRNPYQRLVSCYINKYKVSKDEVFKNYLLGYMSEDKGFKVFCKQVCHIPDRWAERHFVSQYFQIYKQGKCVCDYVGKLENLPKDFEFIRQKYSLCELPVMNSSGNVEWMDYYDRETADMIYERFKADFEKFGYVDEYSKLIRYLEDKEKAEQNKQ